MKLYPLSTPAFEGRTVVITGGASGIGSRVRPAPLPKTVRASRFLTFRK